MPVIDISIGVSTDFGRVRKSSNTNTYPPPGTALVSTSTRTAERFYDGLNTYAISNTLMRFLASLPADATLISVKLRFTPSSIANADTRNLIGDWVNWGPVIDAGDYVDDPTNGAFSVALSALTAGVVNEVALSNFAGNVPRNGYAYLMLGISGGQPTGNNAVTIASPVLRVTYSQVLAPTHLAIDTDESDGVGIDLTVAHRFSWKHNEANGQAQSKYEIEYRVIGAGSWSSTGLITSPNQYHDFAGNFFSANNWEWRVRTTATDGNVSANPTAKAFTAGAAVTAPTVTAPSGSISTATPTVTWTSSEGSRDRYQVEITKDADGAIVFDTGEVAGTALSQAVTTALLDKTAYTARVRIKKSGIWSAWATSAFSVAFAKPKTPQVTAAVVSAGGHNLVTITNPAGGDTFASNRINASEDGGASWVEIAAGLAANATYKDYGAPTGARLYRIRTYGASGSYADSLIASASLSFATGIDAWLHRVDDAEGSALPLGLHAGRLAIARARDVARPKFAGRARRVTRRGKHEQKSVGVQFTWLDADGVLNALLALLATDQTLCLRDFRGHVVYGDVATDADGIALARDEIGFTLEENDFSPGPAVGLGSTLLVDLAAYYPLSDPNDSAGASNLTNHNTATFGIGRVGNCARFVRASNQWLSAADNAALSLSATDFTIDCWVMLDSKPGGGAAPYIVSKTDGTVTGLEYALFWESTEDRFVFITGNGSSIFYSKAASFGAPAIQVWYYLRCSFNNTTKQATISINNGPEDTLTTTGNIPDGANAFGIGGRGDGYDDLDGKIDELGIWKRLLTAAEKVARYHGGLGSTYPFV